MVTLESTFHFFHLIYSLSFFFFFLLYRKRVEAVLRSRYSALHQGLRSEKEKFISDLIQRQTQPSFEDLNAYISLNLKVVKNFDAARQAWTTGREASQVLCGEFLKFLLLCYLYYLICFLR